MMKPVALFFYILLLSGVTLAQPVGFEKILFPIVIHPVTQQQGAFGTQWVSDISILNAGSVPVPLAGTYYCFNCGSTNYPLLPGVTYSIAPVPPAGGLGGSFLFVDSRYVDQLRFGLRVRDVSREAEGFGSEVPVVREKDFRSEGLSLLGVPNGPGARLTLRMYAWDAAGGEVLVKVYGQRPALFIHPSDVFLFEDGIATQRQFTLSSANLGFPENYPAYAQATDLLGSLSGVFRIDIVPLTAGMRIWAMASVTNNTTQQVTVISPH